MVPTLAALWHLLSSGVANTPPRRNRDLAFPHCELLGSTRDGYTGSTIMRSRLLLFLACAVSLLMLVEPVCAKQPKSLFYLTRDPKSVRSFLAHADKIDILVPTWYTVDASGLVSGGPNPLVLETARALYRKISTNYSRIPMPIAKRLPRFFAPAKKTATAAFNLTLRTSVGPTAMP